MSTLLVEDTRKRQHAIAGCFIGTAVGDALGLPTEGLTRARQRRLFGRIDGYRFFLGRGMVSDDTEHALLTAQALLRSGAEEGRFREALAAELRRWILLLPAGVGFATLRACLKLLAGVPPARSGVYSAGNGPAMRAAILGVCIGDEPDRLRALVAASATTTHTDPKAEYGALAIALATHHAATGRNDGRRYLEALRDLLPENEAATEMHRLARRSAESAAGGESTSDFAAGALGLPEGVSGYVYHTVPVALHAWLRHPNDLRAAVLSVIACGGDTDTTAAIAGGIVGASVGEEGIPQEWRSGLCEWPHTVEWMRALAARLARTMTTSRGETPPPHLVPALMLRNLGFLIVVLYHGLRRLLPPY